MIVDIQQRLRDSVRNGLGNRRPIFGLFQVVAEFIKCPQVRLHFERRFGMEPGKVLADQLLQVESQPQTAPLVGIFDQQLQSAQITF